LLGTPNLTFDGTSDKLSVRGELRLPELIVTGPPERAPIAPSRDVVIVGVPPAPAGSAPLALDIRVRVILGDRVLVKLEGLDAQLGGSVDLTIRDMKHITSAGEISVVKGRYKTYGVDLEIVRGHVFYAGGTIDRPTLDILALRTIDEVRAGVTVVGTP